ncbi:rRNA pseudouridine synthase [Marilutibacter aestuarii]|uniref:Dual-specificity RNA pseudouridine synthase RluF n=1 Tax=Marilutibacter aestuarii TaxID=1706195 RepID=A0A508AFC6_9GAMM|nr:rRNA pseudouridine synthase [Lysobacter aestuarii]TQD47623.1 RNA-binding protein [Lysobacter aestuarii]
MPDPVRLAHRVAELFRCSRADAEQYIRNGWVSVDGQVVESPQHPVAEATVELHPDARLEDVEPATVLLHKPPGYDAIEGRRMAAALVQPSSHWTHDPSGIRPLERHFHRLTPLVPLDTDASGLMILTQDGRVWRRLTEDADLIEHEYLVEVQGELAPWGLRRLNHGLSFQDRALPPCKVSWQNETRLRFALKGVREGQLQDMCAQVGLSVLSIRRLRIGSIPIGKGPEGAMPPGQWRYLPVGTKI